MSVHTLAMITYKPLYDREPPHPHPHVELTFPCGSLFDTIYSSMSEGHMQNLAL